MRLALLTALLFAAACSSTAKSGVGVIVVTAPNLGEPVTQLRLALDTGGDVQTALFPTAETTPLSWPKRVSITFTRTSDVLNAQVEGLYQGRTVARGSGRIALSTTGLTLDIALNPVSDTPDLMLMSDLGDAAAAPDLLPPILSLQGDWIFTMDGPETPDPRVTVYRRAADSVTVDAVGGPGCGCNAQTLTLPLGTTYSCQGTTLEFNYFTTAYPNSFSPTNSSSLLITFLNNTTQVGYISASEQSGPSACAVAYSNTRFPSPARLHEDKNQIPLGTLDPTRDGRCSDRFNTLVIHLQAYGCGTGDTSSTTLANVRVY